MERFEDDYKKIMDDFFDYEQFIGNKEKNITSLKEKCDKLSKKEGIFNKFKNFFVNSKFVSKIKAVISTYKAMNLCANPKYEATKLVGSEISKLILSIVSEIIKGVFSIAVIVVKIILNIIKIVKAYKSKKRKI